MFKILEEHQNNYIYEHSLQTLKSDILIIANYY